MLSSQAVEVLLFLLFWDHFQMVVRFHAVWEVWVIELLTACLVKSKAVERAQEVLCEIRCHNWSKTIGSPPERVDCCWPVSHHHQRRMSSQYPSYPQRHPSPCRRSHEHMYLRSTIPLLDGAVAEYQTWRSLSSVCVPPAPPL